MRSPDGSTRLVDADEIARGIAKGAVKVRGAQDDVGVPAFGHALGDSGPGKFRRSRIVVSIARAGIRFQMDPETPRRRRIRVRRPDG